MTKTDIKPCPFCGKRCVGKIYAIKQYLYASVSCDACNVQITTPVEQTDAYECMNRYTFDTVEDAMNAVIEKWNRRAMSEYITSKLWRVME